MEERSIEVIRRLRSIGLFCEIPVVFALLIVSDDVVQVRETSEDGLLVTDVFQAAFQKLQKHIYWRYVEIRVVAIAGIEVWIGNARTCFRGLAVIFDGELKIVVRGIVTSKTLASHM